MSAAAAAAVSAGGVVAASTASPAVAGGGSLQTLPQLQAATVPHLPHHMAMALAGLSEGQRVALMGENF